MKQKLGPLELWQWVAIGAVAGVGYFLYLRGKASAGTASTPAVAQTDNTAMPYGPIDPTTGLPFAFSLLATPAQSATSAASTPAARTVIYPHWGVGGGPGMDELGNPVTTGPHVINIGRRSPVPVR